MHVDVVLSLDYFEGMRIEPGSLAWMSQTSAIDILALKIKFNMLFTHSIMNGDSDSSVGMPLVYKKYAAVYT